MADTIHTQLMQTGYEVRAAADGVDVLRLVREQHAHALLIVVEDASNYSYPGLDESGDEPLATLLRVLVTKTPEPSSTLADSFDKIIGFDLTQVDLQAEYVQKLQNDNEQLRADVARLSENLSAYHNANREIEILKTAIVRNVSHELKTPLLQVKAAVTLLAESLLNEVADVEENTKLSQYAVDATARLEALVRNITLLGGSLDYNPGPVIVHDAVEHSIRNLRRIWQRKSEIDRIRVKLQKPLPPVLADKQGLGTVFQLLIDNALKFSQDEVDVIGETVGDDKVRLSIKDRGIGIAADQHESIFGIFYQVDPSSTRRYGGTGVGLAIVRLILDHHHSHVVVESTINKGSTFSFELPSVSL